MAPFPYHHAILGWNVAWSLSPFYMAGIDLGTCLRRLWEGEFYESEASFFSINPYS
jgi:hypothetical protein